MSTSATTRTRTRGSATPGIERGPWLVVAVTLLAVGMLYARARWPGLLPIGSDNDEYQLAGRAIAALEPPLIAGVEGTKYPLGYPAVLALLQRLGLPVAGTALVLNLAALAATVGMVAHLTGRATVDAPANPGAALAAGGVVVTSVSVWNDAYSVMPELALLVVVSGLLVTLRGPLTGRRFAVLVGLSVAAVLLKSLALLIVVGGCGGLWLAARRRPDLVPGAQDEAPRTGPARRVLAPAGAALLTVLGGMAGMRSLPEHTTGYLATFPLRDPFDASLGTLGPLGLARRTLADVPATFTDLGRAIALIDAGTALAVTIALVGLTLGVIAAHRLHPGTALGPFAFGATVAYALGLAAWPYHSSRFGIPLVPIAALGVGWLVRRVTDTPTGPAALGTDRAEDPASDARRRWGSVAAGGVVLALLVASSWSAVVDRGETAAEQLAAQHQAMDILATFVAAELDDERLVSFDYREVSRRLERPVEPLAYTSDTDALLRQVGDAEVVVMVDIHHTRNRQLGLLLEAEPERFTTLLERDAVAAYRVEH